METVDSYNRKLLSTLKIGDTIKFPRPFYDHYGVYLGDGRVGHLSGDDDDGLADQSGLVTSLATSSGFKINKASVKVDDFLEVAMGTRAAKDNKYDDSCKPYAPEEIVRRFKEMIGCVGYDLFVSNCKHFANWCRYGKAKSEQVETLLTAVSVIGTIGTIGALLLGKN